jgi:hypothetical protein
MKFPLEQGQNSQLKGTQMNRYLFVIMLVLLIGNDSFTQPLKKVSPAVEYQLNKPSSSEVLVWVFFADKGSDINTLKKYHSNIVSEKSIQRRKKVIKESNPLDITDFPVNQEYIFKLETIGVKIKKQSKWLNGVTVYADNSEINEIEKLPFVKSIDIVYQLPNRRIVEDDNLEFSKPFLQPEGVHSYNYGNSFTQLQQMNVPAVHDLGIKGQGVTIAVLDAGFNRLSHEVFATMNIIAAWDFVNNDANVGDHGDMGEGSHGTQTLSTIGGFKEGKLIGPAFNSSYILAKTENTDSETPIEEDNWIAAIEWADSIGVDVSSTSLGYIDFDFPYTSYTWQSMDGNTCRITIAADLAVKKGIVVLNSAGNEGMATLTNTLGAPADGDSVIAVGAVTSSGARSSFSSVGNTVDGRIKPDIMAMGSSVTVASPYSNTTTTTSSGTSFSCPLAAGVAALVLSYNPNLTPIQVRDALRSTASNALTPDRLMGWGIVNAMAAINFHPVPVEGWTFKGTRNNFNIVLAWQTISEKNNKGFEIERSIDKTTWTQIAFIEGSGTTTKVSEYTYSDYFENYSTLYYRFKQIDLDGSFKYSDVLELDKITPTKYELSQNYPNPFNPTTRIDYKIPITGRVTLKVFDILGNELSTLINEIQDAGNYSVNFNSTGFASGIYFYALQVGEFREIKKMVLVR